MTTQKLEPVADGVWTVRVPFRFLGVLELGTRMTILRTGDGDGDGLVLHSPVPIDAQRKAAIDALGTVRAIVAPSLYHHVFAGDAARLWPEATLHAPQALRKKRPELAITADLEDGPADTWGGAIEAFPVRGCILQETLLYHRPSRTLVTSDLFENFRDVPDLVTRSYLKLGGVYGKPGWHWLLRPVYRDKRAARESLEPVFAREIERVVLAHGDLVTERAVSTMREALAFLG